MKVLPRSAPGSMFSVHDIKAPQHLNVMDDAKLCDGAVGQSELSSIAE